MFISEYFGNNLTTAQYDSIAISRINIRHLSKEPKLMSVKWFDYRTLHPTCATYLFAHHYVLEYRKIYQKIKDKEIGRIKSAFVHPEAKADKIEFAEIKKERALQRKVFSAMLKEKLTDDDRKELKEEKRLFNDDVREVNERMKERRRNRSPIDVLTLPEALGLWKGRQSADILGIPYDFYIGTALRFLIEGSIWQRIPRPVHLYSEKVKEFTLERWVETLNTGIVEPEMSNLSDDNLFSTQCKQDIVRYLCECIQMRKNGHFALSHYMCDLKIITEQTAIKYFSELTIQKAKKFYLE